MVFKVHLREGHKSLKNEEVEIKNENDPDCGHFFSGSICLNLLHLVNLYTWHT